MNINDKPLKIFLNYFKPHLSVFIFDMICAVLIAIIDVAFPMVTRYLLNIIIPNHNFQVFFITILILLGGYLLRSLCNWFITYWGHVFGIRVEQDMRTDVFNHLEEQSFSFYDSNRTGNLMANATTDLFDITELAHHGPEDLLIATLTLIGSFIMLLKIQWELAVIIIIALPIMIITTVLFRKTFSKSSKNVKESMADLSAELESSISGIRVTKIFTNEKYEIKRFSKINQNYSKKRKVRFKQFAFFHTSIEFCNNLLSLLVIGIGGFFIMQKKMTLSDLVATNLFVASFVSPIRKFTNFVEQYTTGMAGFSRFLEFMKTDITIKEVKNAIEINECEGNIEFKNVTFAYKDNLNVLENVNLQIPSGNKFALVGSSGGGKTTICNLIPRFYDVFNGNIFIDGIDIKKITHKSLRQQIGIVQQDVFLFAGTIFENILYGKINATKAEVIEAAKRAEIHDEILKMPNGYDTIVGERGVKLSGGQKQRISIARCFLKNPKILILDEATSALDIATELKIQHAFDELAKGRTSIIIAHRLSTIKNSDKIAVVEEKSIVELGNHNELMNQKGFYYQQYSTQSSLL